MSLIDKMPKASGFSVPICEMCAYFIKYGEGGKICCKAYPDGLPDEVNEYSNEMLTRKCSEEYSFKKAD